MRRRDFLAIMPLTAALRPRVQSALAADSQIFTQPTIAVANVKHFGAKGDGVTDDWRAIENAGLYLASRGGGRMYFPTGRYLLPTFGKNLTVRNHVEYFGDGESSVIIGSNGTFISPNGAIFGRNGYHRYDYFPATDIGPGDQFIRAHAAKDAAHFRPGDIIIARSITAIEIPDDILPHYLEMNRVVSVDDEIIHLEDPIDDGCRGVLIANVTGDVSQGYSIHDLRIESEKGFPIFIQASYKSEIRNCWTRGFSVMTTNGFTRSVARDIEATVLWTDRTESVLEIETGSVRASVHDIHVKIEGVPAPDRQYPLLYCQEFSRRTSIWNVRIDASAYELRDVIQAGAGGHSFENIRVIARSVDKVLDYFGGDPEVFSLNHLPLTLRSVEVETLDANNGFNHGFVIHNNYPNGTVENVTVQNCSITGATDQREHNLIWFLSGDQRNVLCEDVRGNGDVKVGREDRGSKMTLTNVEVRDCQFRQIAAGATAKQVAFANNRRFLQQTPPAKTSP